MFNIKKGDVIIDITTENEYTVSDAQGEHILCEEENWFYTKDLGITLFPKEVWESIQEVIPQLAEEWNTPKEGDPVLVRDSEEKPWLHTFYVNSSPKGYYTSFRKDLQGCRYFWTHIIPYDEELVGTI